MTKIKFFKKQDSITGFECSGHTKEILCAALSGMTQSCMIGLTHVLKIKVLVKRNDNDGYLKIELPKKIDQEKMKLSQVLFNTLLISIEDLIDGYSKYISMEVIENDY